MFTPQSRIGLTVARFLMVDFTIATCLGLWHMFNLGTCATGGSFESAFDCADSAMTWAMVFGIGLTGSIIASFFTGFVFGFSMMFVPTGLTAIAYAIVGEPGPGGDMAAWIIGLSFLLVGLPVAIFGIKEALGDGDTRPDESTRRNAANYMQNMNSVNPWAAAPSVPGDVPIVKPAAPVLARTDFDEQRKSIGI